MAQLAGRRRDEPATFVIRPKGRWVVRQLRMGPAEVISRPLSDGESVARSSKMRSKSSKLMSWVGTHDFRVQDTMRRRARVNKEVSEAVALNRARSLSAEAGSSAPFPPVVVWTRVGAQFLAEHEGIDADASSANAVELSLRPTAEVVNVCIKGTCNHWYDGPEAPAHSAVTEPWVVDTGRGVDLISAHKVRRPKMRPASDRLNTTTGATFSMGRPMSPLTACQAASPPSISIERRMC